MKKLKDLWKILKLTFKDWSARNVGTEAASLAYSAIFSVPGLLIIVIWVAGIFFGEEAVRGEITKFIGGMMGKDVGKSVEEMVVSGMVDKQNFWMKAFGVGTLVFGATSVFFQLQKSLNRIWDVEAVPKKAWEKYLLDRASSFGMILIIAFLLLITLILSSIIGLANAWLIRKFGIETSSIINLINIGISLLVTCALFAFMFKVLPDVDINWRSVWIGALFTAVLFAVGKYLLTLYFENFKPTSAFGAAGTVILIMMWVNYTCQLIFLGAGFTKVYANFNGHPVKPSRHARPAPMMVSGKTADKNTVAGAAPVPEVDHSQKTTVDTMI